MFISPVNQTIGGALQATISLFIDIRSPFRQQPLQTLVEHKVVGIRLAKDSDVPHDIKLNEIARNQIEASSDRLRDGSRECIPLATKNTSFRARIFSPIAAL